MKRRRKKFHDKIYIMEFPRLERRRAKKGREVRRLLYRERRLIPEAILDFLRQAKGKREEEHQS